MRLRIGKLPLGLQTAYDEIVDQIQRQDGSGPEVAKRAIRWVMCSREPLSTAQLLGAVCQCPDDGDTVYAVDIDADFVLGACRNLLVVDAEYHTWRFSHLSVQEYFENLFRVRSLHEWSYSSIHALAAKVCLLLLITGSSDGDADECSSRASDCSRSGCLRKQSSSVSIAKSTTAIESSMTTNLIVAGSAVGGDDDPADEDNSYDFTVGLLLLKEYAEISWMDHVRMGCEDEIDPRLTCLLKRFLGTMDDSGPAYRAWAKPGSELHEALTYELMPSSFACFAICHFGLDRVLTDWWHVGFHNSEQQNSHGSTLLTLAAGAGSAAIVRHLLDRGADVNRHDPRKGTPLALASRRGHIPVVKILLDHGSDVNSACGDVLRGAALRGETPLARLLLDRGADVNAYSTENGSALVEVSGLMEKTAMVRLLLDYGAEVNLCHQLYGTALQQAASRGYAAVAQLLLERGADVNVQGGRHSTALQAAAAAGSEDIVKLLLDYGAAINAYGDKYGTALHAAAARPNVSVVKLLLNRGANIFAEGGEYGSALQAASHYGQKAVVELLIEGGANVNEHCGRYGSPLQAATSRRVDRPLLDLILGYRCPFAPKEDDSHNPPYDSGDDGYLSMLQLLLDRGADVNAQGRKYGTALQAAAGNGEEEAVLLLLERGADIGAGGGKFGSALQAAARNGDEAVVKLLLDRGADVRAAGGKFGSALQAASRSGVAAVVTLLLDCGADDDAQGGCYGNALQAACHSGHESVAKLLLDCGASLNAQHERNTKHIQSALHAAARSGFGSIVRLLIERGVDLNAQYGGALVSAAASDRTSVILLLLEHRDKVDRTYPHHENALWIAEDLGCDSSTHLLREHCPELSYLYESWSDAEDASAEETKDWPDLQTHDSETTGAEGWVEKTMTRVRSAASEARW